MAVRSGGMSAIGLPNLTTVGRGARAASAATIINGAVAVVADITIRMV